MTTMMGTQDPTTRDFALDVLGTKMQARTLDDALQAASLDWTVSKRPLIAQTAHGDVLIPGKFAMLRTTVNETVPYVALGVTGQRYTTLQNRDAFGFVDTVLESRGDELFVDFAGSMYDGRKVFLDVKLPETIMVGGFDPVEARLLMVNSHDGTAPFSLSLHVNRIPCTNAIEFTKRSAKRAQQHWTMRHTSSIEGRVQAARETLSLTFAALDEFQVEAQELIAKTITDRQFERMIENEFPIAHDATAKQRNAIGDTRLAVRTIYRESPTQEGIRGTAWGAVNAFVEYADWSREVRPGKRDAVEARALAQVDSRHVANFKAGVMGRALALK